MSLSIITPHYNDWDGLKRIFNCLFEQTLSDWEWIIVDDFSDKNVVSNIKEWVKSKKDSRIRYIENAQKSNASVCRNIGMNIALFESLVFLDADDYIAKEFVANRHIEYDEFAIFPNYHIVDYNGNFEKKELKNEIDLLNKFLSAQFLWQTSCVLWNKRFLIQIGKFDPNLERLQDVELTIRSLFEGKNFKVIDNKVDFFYQAKPIRSKTDIVRTSCNSVNYLITKLHNTYPLNAHRRSLIKGYYYACAKNLHRTTNRKDVVYVKESLKLFYKKEYIHAFQYFVGFGLLFLYQYHIMSHTLFIRFNRYFFKK